MTEAEYINHFYGTCKIWPCSCQQKESKRLMDYEDRFLCDNWIPCEDKSWKAMHERIENEKNN